MPASGPHCDCRTLGPCMIWASRFCLSIAVSAPAGACSPPPVLKFSGRPVGAVEEGQWARDGDCQEGASCFLQCPQASAHCLLLGLGAVGSACFSGTSLFAVPRLVLTEAHLQGCLFPLLSLCRAWPSSV